MNRYILLIGVILLLLSFCACDTQPQAQVVATTMPVFTFTAQLCEGTGLTVSQLITDNVSCIHDYSLQVSQMQMLSSADVIVCSGAGLEEFIEDLFQPDRNLIDASTGIDTLCSDHGHDEHTAHTHGEDPHIWLSPIYAKIMATNICDGLCLQFPEHREKISSNLSSLQAALDSLYDYGNNQLSDLSSREIITFHDGFSYFAQCFQLNILHCVEEESGSEASASQLIQLIQMIDTHDLHAMFTETNGSTAAAQIISAETGVPVYTLDMAISGDNYFDAMYHNIDTIKEALG